MSKYVLRFIPAASGYMAVDPNGQAVGRIFDRSYDARTGEFRLTTVYQGVRVRHPSLKAARTYLNDCYVNAKNPLSDSRAREARLNAKEAKAHLDVIQKALGRARASASPGTSAVRGGRNPVPKGKRAKLEDATKRYERFRDQDSKHIVECHLPKLSGPLIGFMSSISYTTVRAGKVELYRHDFAGEGMEQFASRIQPQIFSIKGKQLIRSAGGHFTFTERGFEDAYHKTVFNTIKPDFSVCTEVGLLDAYQYVTKMGKEYRVTFKKAERPILAVTANGDAIITILRK